MKNIFRFLGIVVLGLMFGRGFSQNVVNPKKNLRVRYAVELKEVTKAEAESYLTANGGTGYVDLWSYVYFSPEWVSQGYITLNGSTPNLLMVGLESNSHSYKMIDNQGNDYTVGDVAVFAPRSGVSSCGSISQEFIKTGWVSMSWKQLCPSWAYGGITVSQAAGAPGNLIEAVSYNGETWYRIKQYPIRFVYKKAESFYVTFFSNKGGLDNGSADGGLNLNITDPARNGWPIVWNNWDKCPSGTDWMFAKYNWETGDPLNPCSKDVDAIDLISGGLKIISDPEMLLTAEATCGGTDLPGKLTVNDWARKTWDDYSGVKFYVNKTGGTVRKPLTASDIATTPSPIPTSGTAAEIAYTLTPSGYTMDGSYADSLIWVIEDTFLA